ncbi:MAG: hypothetical protein ACI8UO_004856 [Verrucomicrobiales bacterium]|jgi:hypothetical protein
MDLDKALKDAGIDLAKAFDLEIVIRNPLPNSAIQDALRGRHGYVDQQDLNTLQWAGDRGTGTVPAHPFRCSPMFFRDNGMALDLVDLQRGANIFLILNGPSFAEIDHQQLPDPEAYEDLRHRDAIQADGTSARLHLILTPDSLAELPPAIRDFWLPIHAALSSPDVKNALFAPPCSAVSDAKACEI